MGALTNDLTSFHDEVWLARMGVIRDFDVLVDGLEDWMRRHDFTTPDQFRGRLAVPAGVDQTAYERAGYVAALEKARHTYGDVVVGDSTP